MRYSDILSNIKTVQHAQALASEIDILLDALFKTDINAFEKALNSISILASQTLREALRSLAEPGLRQTNQDNSDSNNKQAIKEYLIGLKEQLQKLKTLKLSLAFEVSEGSIDNLFAWVLKNLGPGIIMDIQKDKTILGGAIIEYGGKYRDFSLRKTLEEVFASKRERIMSVVKG